MGIVLVAINTSKSIWIHIHVFSERIRNLLERKKWNINRHKNMRIHIIRTFSVARRESYLHFEQNNTFLLKFIRFRMNRTLGHPSPYLNLTMTANRGDRWSWGWAQGAKTAWRQTRERVWRKGEAGVWERMEGVVCCRPSFFVIPGGLGGGLIKNKHVKKSATRRTQIWLQMGRKAGHDVVTRLCNASDECEGVHGVRWIGGRSKQAP